MTPRRVLFAFLFILSFGYLCTTMVYAWYGASTNGVPATTDGLVAEVIAPFYSESPAVYTTGTTITLTTKVSNPTAKSATVSAYFRVYKISQAPNGTDISDGDPGETGLTEAKLFSHYSAATSTTSLLTSSGFAPTDLPSSTEMTLSAMLTPLSPGYYQFVFSTVNADVDPASGTLLSTGFIRVLDTIATTPTPTPSVSTSPSPTPSPTSTATPTVTSTPSPTITATPQPTVSPTPGVLSDGKQTILALSTPTCANRNTTVTLRLLLNARPVPGKAVHFVYAGEAKEAMTDAAGDASVVYGFKSGADTVVATPPDEYPIQSEKIVDVPNCPVSSSPTPATGQVLGAYAETGLAKTDLYAFALFAALALMSVGLFLYGASLVL